MTVAETLTDKQLAVIDHCTTEAVKVLVHHEGEQWVRDNTAAISRAVAAAVMVTINYMLDGRN